jgi:N utilization substance protein B
MVFWSMLLKLIKLLRTGIYEMKFGSEVPALVAIDEAIEIAKSYGGASSGKFVNGILGAIYKDVKETKKEDNNVVAN